MKNVTTRFLLTCAVVGAAGGIILTPVLVIFTTPMVLAAPLAYAAVVGLWFLPGAITQHLTRRGGASTLTMLIAGLVTVPFTPYGILGVASMLMVGLLQEVPLLVTGWRRYLVWLVYAWTVVVALAYGYYLWYGTQAPADLGYVEGGNPADTAAGGLSVEVLLIMLPIVAVTCLLFTWIGHLVADALARTGVGRGLRPAPKPAKAGAATAVPAEPAAESKE